MFSKNVSHACPRAVSVTALQQIGARLERKNLADGRERATIKTLQRAQTSELVLYFPQTHDLLKDLALSAAAASHLKQTNDRLSEEGKLFEGIVWI